jgi:hypothetical protein
MLRVAVRADQAGEGAVSALTTLDVFQPAQDPRDIGGAWLHGGDTQANLLAQLDNPDPDIRREMLIYYVHSEYAERDVVARLISNPDPDMSSIAARRYLDFQNPSPGVLQEIAKRGGPLLVQLAQERLAEIGCGGD